MYEELKELKELLDMGAITQEEFDAKKTELLSVAFNEKDLTNPAVPSSTSDSLTQQKSKMAAPPITSDTVTQNNKFATRFKKTLLAMLAVCLLCALCITSCACILNSFNDSSSPLLLPPMTKTMRATMTMMIILLTPAHHRAHY